MEIAFLPYRLTLKLSLMDRIKKIRMAFCKYLYSIAKEKSITIEDIMKSTNKSYSEVKKILEGLMSPTFDDMLQIAELLNVHMTLTPDLSLGHKKIWNQFLG
jgi:transcriptional regulator with XRE-family HTH domain